MKLKNTQPLTTIYLPVQYTDGPDVHWTGAQRGDRISYFEDFETVAFDPVNHRFTLKATANVGGGSPPLPPGDGEIVKLIFSSSDTALGGETAGVDSTVQSNYTVKLLTDFASYGPQVYGGEARVITVQRGDVNFDHELNIADLTYLVEYEFMGGAPPVSFASADVDADRSITIADITYLATYEFKHGPEPPPLQ